MLQEGAGKDEEERLRDDVRKSEREIKDRAAIDSIIRESVVCRLGLSDGEEPYIVPLCFGYDGRALYFHSAIEGRKIDVLRKNSRVCFEFDIPEGMKEAEEGCRWGIRYRSVIGAGTAAIVRDHGEKIRALEIIMAQYSRKRYSFPEEIVAKTAIMKITITEISGKQA
ncbi:MAG TPA: pyridoxamine 5'-phosphate oxidase family protein [Syntrophales bacterium]|nr:pyridoxamine 5'-phosphate oxidase family protein [Syntrophales bacterium]